MARIPGQKKGGDDRADGTPECSRVGVSLSGRKMKGDDKRATTSRSLVEGREVDPDVSLVSKSRPRLTQTEVKVTRQDGSPKEVGR